MKITKNDSDNTFNVNLSLGKLMAIRHALLKCQESNMLSIDNHPVMKLATIADLKSAAARLKSSTLFRMTIKYTSN